jgi:hypothetical protein
VANGFGLPTSSPTTTGIYGSGTTPQTPATAAATGKQPAYAGLLAKGDFAGAFASAQGSGQLNEMLSSAPATLTAAFPKGMSETQFEQYYEAFAPYQQSMSGQTVAQGAAGNANSQWGPPVSGAAAKADADAQYKNDLLSGSNAQTGGSFGQGTAKSATLPIPNVTTLGDNGQGGSGFMQAKPDKSFMGEYGDEIALGAIIAFSGGALAPVAEAALAPTLGAVGGGVAGGAAVGAGLGALQGQIAGTGAGKGALLGGLTGGVTGGMHGLSSTGGLPTGAEGVALRTGVGAGVGAATGAITGTGAGQGALMGGISGGISGLAHTATAQNDAGNILGGFGGTALGAGAGLATKAATSLLGSGNTSGSNMSSVSSNGVMQAAPVYSNTGTALQGGTGVAGSFAGTALQALGSTAGAIGASAAQAQGEQQGIETQSNTMGNINSIYGTQQQLGTGADTSLANALGQNGAAGNASATAAYQAQPGFASTIQYGNQAAERQAAAMGGAGNIGTAMTIGAYDTNTANQYYNQYVNQLMGAAGLGQSANQALTGAQLETGSNISQLQQNKGNANASAFTGTASAMSPLLGAAGNLLSGGGSNPGGGTNANSSGVNNPNSTTYSGAGSTNTVDQTDTSGNNPYLYTTGDNGSADWASSTGSGGNDVNSSDWLNLGGGS